MEINQTPSHADFETTEYFFYLNYPGSTGECLHYYDSYQSSLQEVHDPIHILMLQPVFGVCGMDYHSNLILMSVKKTCLSSFKV